MFANDMFREGKPNSDSSSWGRITLGDDVSIGSGATILAVSICDGVVIGAGSVVTRSIQSLKKAYMQVIQPDYYAVFQLDNATLLQRKFTLLSLVMSYNWNLRPSC